MNVSDIDSSVYGLMLGEDINQLSDISLDNNVPKLASSLDAISELVMAKVSSLQLKSADPADRAKLIAEKVADAYNSLKQDVRMVPCFDIITRMSARMGEEVNTVFNTIETDVVHDVDDIEDDIDNETTEELEHEGIVDETVTDTEMKFRTCNWDKIMNAFGGRNIILENVKAFTGYTPIMSADEGVQIGDSVNNNISDVPVDKETAEDIQNRVAENLEVKDDEAVAEMYKALTKNYDFHNFLHMLYLQEAKQHNYPHTVHCFEAGIKRFLPILKAFKKTPINTTDKIFDAIHTNIDKMLANFEVGAYTVAAMREELFNRKSVLLDETTINEDVVKDDDINSDNSLNDENIKMYLHSFHTSKNRPIPILGVSATEIQSFGSAAKNMYKEDLASKQANMANYQQKAKYAATEKKLKGYLESIDSSFIPKGLTRSDFVKGHFESTAQRVLHNLYAGTDNSLQSLLFDFVIDVKYPNSKLKSIHRRFGELAANAVAETQDVVENDKLNAIDGIVATEMITALMDDTVFK